MTSKEYQERIRNLEEKICRQRADLARCYNRENAYIQSLKDEVATHRDRADMWHDKWKALKEKKEKESTSS